MRGILLDRDGVINRERPDYVKQWSEFEFLPGALPALRRLATLDWPILVVTNQSAIGRGLVTLDTVADIHRRMTAAVVAAGGRIDAVFVCPHHPDAGCNCRKPRPGLLLQAAGQFNLDLSQSYLVGDAASDIQAGLAAGCRSILVQTNLPESSDPSLLRTRLSGRLPGSLEKLPHEGGLEKPPHAGSLEKLPHAGSLPHMVVVPDLAHAVTVILAQAWGEVTNSATNYANFTKFSW